MTYADMTRQVQGAKSKAQGQHFEARLDAAFTYYRDQGMADIEKTPEPMHPIKNMGGGKFVAYFEKKAQADYSGVLRGGRAIVMEAKYTTTDRITQDRVTKEQANFLDGRQALGAWCFVLAGFSTGRVYRLPWVVWRDMKDAFGRKYVIEADLAEFRVPVRGAIIMVLEGLV